MQVVLQGSLRHFGVAELLSFLCGRGESGTLEVQGTDRQARVLFVGDLIVWAESSRIADPKEAVLDLFDWHAGSFTLADSVVVPAHVVPLGLDVAPLIAEAKLRAESAGVYPDATLFRVIDDPALQQQVSLTGDQFRLLFRLSSGRTFRDLVGDLGATAQEVSDRLRALVQIGLVEVATPEPPPASLMKTDPQLKKRTTSGRHRTLVGSLTPDGAPDNVYPLLDSAYTLGRAQSNTIAIADGSVSSNHARILRTPEGFVLEDLQSRNGTFVNGEQVQDKRVLVDGDLIRLGKIIMTFNVAREGRAGEKTEPEVRLV
ncbi:MAG: FHA domain-containing protein [Acidobacteriota bacterium]|nr:FHA domain-containing protein [Acidobacteriota bacterium]